MELGVEPHQAKDLAISAFSLQPLSPFFVIRNEKQGRHWALIGLLVEGWRETEKSMSINELVS